jgi:site-specific recombinase XerD
LGATAVKATVDKAVRAAGLSKRVTSHLFRHAFATHLLNRGADIYSLSQMLGHKDIRSTIVYLQVATERLSAIHRKYHPRR